MSGAEPSCSARAVPQELLPELCDYDVVVFTTFPDAHVPIAEQMLEKGCQKQRWVYTVHDPREVDLDDPMFPPAGKPRVCAARAVPQV